MRKCREISRRKRERGEGKGKKEEEQTRVIKFFNIKEPNQLKRPG